MSGRVVKIEAVGYREQSWLDGLVQTAQQMGVCDLDRLCEFVDAYRGAWFNKPPGLREDPALYIDTAAAVIGQAFVDQGFMWVVVSDANGKELGVHDGVTPILPMRELRQAWLDAEIDVPEFFAEIRRRLPSRHENEQVR